MSWSIWKSEIVVLQGYWLERNENHLKQDVFNQVTGNANWTLIIFTVCQNKKSRYKICSGQKIGVNKQRYTIQRQRDKSWQDNKRSWAKKVNLTRHFNA